ncbi:MAG: sigma-70 family RNA polymerase sigma factor [Hyphomonadaceae bacterium]|nr:sigma-70 family RNA polymerase sigma factor [Hyphomonadaceae bacterium]
MNLETASRGLAMLLRPAAVEAALWRRRAESDGIARERLFLRYRALARMVAGAEFKRRPAYGLERADFDQFAFGGLLESIDSFDTSYGVPFEHFARPRIVGAISDGLARASEAGARWSQARKVGAERVRSLLGVSAGSRPDKVAELADLASALAAGFLAAEADASAADANVSVNPYESLAWRELSFAVSRELDALPDPEGRVLRRHYRDGVAFSHIATLLGVTKGRISQIHAAGLNRLRDRLRAFW